MDSISFVRIALTWEVLKASLRVYSAALEVLKAAIKEKKPDVAVKA